MLEKLFTSKVRVKLLDYFLMKGKSGKLREISKNLNVSVSAISREVNNLVNLGLIKKSSEGFELNKSCNFIDDLKRLFIKTDGLVYPIKSVLNDKRIKFALIFGSFARGTHTVESDVDVLIIGEISLSSAIKFAGIAERKINRTINPVVWSVKDIKEKKKTGFVRDIFTKKIIMLKGDENELRKLVK